MKTISFLVTADISVEQFFDITLNSFKRLSTNNVQQYFLLVLVSLFSIYVCVCQERGIPGHAGLLYSMGLALVMEGALSACYHLCPNKMNFQFGEMRLFCYLYVSCTYQSRQREPSIKGLKFSDLLCRLRRVRSRPWHAPPPLAQDFVCLLFTIRSSIIQTLQDFCLLSGGTKRRAFFISYAYLSQYLICVEGLFL